MDTTTNTATTTITVELPVGFYDAHTDAGLTAGVEVHRTKKLVKVEATRAVYDSLLTRARDRAESADMGQRTSGKAALKRLEAVEWPAEEGTDQLLAEVAADLDAIQDSIAALRTALNDRLDQRRRIMRDARDRGVSLYAIAKMMDMTYSAARSTIERRQDA